MKGISVIIPTYNREKYLPKAINSVLAQNYTGPIEIIISDDGSTDNTIKTLKKFGNNIRILIRKNKIESCGASAARNRGIEASTHPYLCFLDSDDYFLPNHLNKMVSIIESNPKIDFAFCKLLELDETRSTNLFRAWTKPTITKNDIRYLILSKHNVAATHSFMFKKEVFTKAGIFNEKLLNGEDTDLWIRVIEQCNGAFSNHFGGVIRKHNNEQLTKHPEKLIINNLISIFYIALKRNLSFKQKNIFIILKLTYMYWKYQAFTIPYIYKIQKYIDEKKERNKKSVQWLPLNSYLI